MTLLKRGRRGQALVMVTLALFAMFGMIGLAVDLGWSFYVKRSAQSAADAAALAAVEETWAKAGSGTLTCGTSNVVCWTDPQPCSTGDDPDNNLDNGCRYAAQNGFSDGGSGGRQHVTIQSNVPTPGCFPNCIPTAPGVHAFYWVTVRVTEEIPQLFSALLGHGMGKTAARATAAIADSKTLGSLILLNRESDPNYGDDPPTGTDLLIGGDDEINVPGGILLASTSTVAGDFKGEGGGEGEVHTPYTYIRGADGHGGLPEYARSRWDNWYQNQPDSADFRDPFEGKGQPPLTNENLPLHPVPQSQGNQQNELTAEICPGGVCPEGIYYAVNADGLPTGDPIYVPTPPKGSGWTRWTFGSGSLGSTFDDFTFFGGLSIGAAPVDFGPGRYVMAGVKQAGTPVISTENATEITGGGLNGTGGLADAGRLFILTDSTYPGLTTQVQAVNNATGGTLPTLSFSTSNFKSGANDKSSISLYGLNKSIAHSETNTLGYTLNDFGNVLIWQDQRNSNVVYNTDGTINETCGADSHSTCYADPVLDRNMALSANQSSHLEGVVYQPRGATVTIWAGTGYSGPIALISGGLVIQGSGELTLTGPLQPMTRRVCTLVE